MSMGGAPSDITSSCRGPTFALFGPRRHRTLAAPLRLANLEAQELVAEPDQVARHEAVRPAQAQEGSVRAAEILEPAAPVAVRELRVPPRHELVVGEDDVAALAPQDLVGAGQ